jgi:hypothetical protein
MKVNRDKKFARRDWVMLRSVFYRANDMLGCWDPDDADEQRLIDRRLKRKLYALIRSKT